MHHYNINLGLIHSNKTLRKTWEKNESHHHYTIKKAKSLKVNLNLTFE